MSLIEISGDRAVINANPEAKLVSFLDRWDSHGYLASIVEEDGFYRLGRVFYDLNKVDLEKVKEVADKIDKGEFECPVCQRLTMEKEKEEGAESGAKEEKEREEEKQPELDEEEIREQNRKKAIREIVNALDQVLMYRILK